MKKILGIAPGIGGGIAMIHPEDGLLVETMPSIQERYQKYSEVDEILLAEFILVWKPDHAIVEQPGPNMRQGIQAAFRTGSNYGKILGALAGAQIITKVIRPHVWMHEMEVAPAQFAEAATRLFPKARAAWRAKSKNLGAAKAALIAEFGRRTL